MPRLSLASSAALAALAASSAFAQGDPEAATAILRGRPTKSWQPWQPKPTYALNELPDYYMGVNRAGNGIDQVCVWHARVCTIAAIVPY
jgi:streptomycin 6-kinase